MNLTIYTTSKALLLLFVCATLPACDKVPNSAVQDLGQQAGDVLNPDGRRREARVAGEASAAAHAATETARQANEMAQSNLKAAANAKAEAEKILLEAKAEAARAAAELKAKEATTEAAKTHPIQTTPK